MKLIVLSEIIRFWNPLKQPLPRPCHDLLLQDLQFEKTENLVTSIKPNKSIRKSAELYLIFFPPTYPACDLEVPERTGDDCGREWVDPVILEVEDVEEEEASSPGLLLDERENGPGKLSSIKAYTTYWTHHTKLHVTSHVHP